MLRGYTTNVFSEPDAHIGQIQNELAEAYDSF